jgi:dipicolinate synthase subunit B
MSETVYSSDTRFGNCEDLRNKVSQICGKEIVHTIIDAEPLGPQISLDALVICPCTGNTLGKLANGITDTSVTMAAKAHLRNEKPLIIAVSTNDALGASAKNIGALLNCKNIFFVPFKQDMPEKKHNSCISDFSLIPDTIEKALKGIQIQPILK